MAKSPDFKDFFEESKEMKYDSRLLDKKVVHKQLKLEDRDAFLKALPEEVDFDFTSMTEIEKVDVGQV